MKQNSTLHFCSSLYICLSFKHVISHFLKEYTYIKVPKRLRFTHILDTYYAFMKIFFSLVSPFFISQVCQYLESFQALCMICKCSQIKEDLQNILKLFFKIFLSIVTIFLLTFMYIFFEIISKILLLHFEYLILNELICKLLYSVH